MLTPEQVSALKVGDLIVHVNPKHLATVVNNPGSVYSPVYMWIAYHTGGINWVSTDDMRMPTDTEVLEWKLTR